jgi:hypothetical protein
MKSRMGLGIVRVRFDASRKSVDMKERTCSRRDSE